MKIKKNPYLILRNIGGTCYYPKKPKCCQITVLWCKGFLTVLISELSGPKCRLSTMYYKSTKLSQM